MFNSLGEVLLTFLFDSWKKWFQFRDELANFTSKFLFFQLIVEFTNTFFNRHQIPARTEFENFSNKVTSPEIFTGGILALTKLYIICLVRGTTIYLINRIKREPRTLEIILN